MEKYYKQSYAARYIILIVILVNIVSEFRTRPFFLLITTIIYLGIIVNDYLRHKGYFWEKGVRYYLFSILFSIFGGAIIAFLVRGYSDIYMYMLIYEIIFYSRERFLKRLLSIQLFLILIVWISRMNISNELLNLEFWRENTIEFFMSLLFIFFYVVTLMAMKYQAKEKMKVLKLNNELEESYEKLREYSNQIEKLTISKERNRVAQEIHDSLGHSLTALIMHLDFIEKIIDTDGDKARELTGKAQVLARDSMGEVRRAVYALKDQYIERELVFSIAQLIDNFKINNKVKVACNVDQAVEGIAPNIKSVIFRTIQEGLTNSIRHGRASEIKIGVRLRDIIEIIIKDNGIGCNNITMGNGLNGIVNRINEFSGNIRFKSSENAGFTIEISIPIEEESNGQDESDAS